MINYNWHLRQVDIKYLPDTQEAQLLEVHWSCVAVDDQDPENLVASSYGSIGVEDMNLIAPAATVKNATKAQVMQYLNTKLGDEKQKIKDNLAGRIAALGGTDSFVPVD